MVFNFLKEQPKMSAPDIFLEQIQSTNVSPVLKCNICLYSFRTSTELNLHILNHFQKLNCSICRQNLILIGNIWYGPHEHVNHELNANRDIVKCELEAIDADESQIEPVNLPAFVEITVGDASIFRKERDAPFLADIHHESIKTEGDLYGNYDQMFDEGNEVRENLTEKHDSIDNSTTQKTQSKTVRRKTKNSTNPPMEITFSDIEMEHSNLANEVEDCNENIAETLDETNLESGNSDSEEKTPSKRKNGKNGDKFCNFCNKQFICGSGFKYHMNAHLGLKPYACDLCDEAYSDRRKLSVHKRTHEQAPDTDDGSVEMRPKNKIKLSKEQLKNLVCPVCSKTFASRKYLKSHMNVHNGSKYMCTLCNRTFRDVNNYQRHRMTVHKNVAPSENVDENIEVGVRNLNEEDPAESTQNAVDWVCEYCNNDFEFELRLAKHIIREHNEEKPEQLFCYICGSKFNSQNELLTHMRAHGESTQYKCTYPDCGQGFAYKASLGVHLNKHRRINNRIERKTQDQITELTKQHAAILMASKTADGQDKTIEKTLVCHICGKLCTARTNLLAHIQYVHSNSDWIKCPIDGCEKIYKSMHGIMTHMQNIHPEAIKKCQDCGKSFHSEEKLAEHRVKHDRSRALFECAFCGKRFSEKLRLRVHLASHGKDVACNICDMKFSSLKLMMAHRQKHGQKLIIRCRFKDCNQTFETRQEFVLHKKQHSYEKGKKFICNYCGKPFSTMSYLRGHINVHTGARPFVCKICGKSFAKDGSLRRHNLIHTGAKPYACPIEGCTQAYRDSIDLKRHKFSAHNIYTKKHICQICTKVFPERKLLTKHTNSVHGKLEIDPKTSHE